MFYSTTAGYTGKQFEKGYIGSIATDTFFVILAIEEGMSEADGTKILAEMKENFTHAEITNLSAFESTISSFIMQHNLPAHVSLAAGLLHDSVLYVKTIGNGQVYYRRGKDFALLMDGDKSASGFVKEYDCAVFTTIAIKKVIGEINDIKLFVDMNAPKDVIEKMHNEEYDEEDRGFIALVAEFTSQPAISSLSNVSVPPNIQSPQATSPSPVESTPLPATPPATRMQDPFSSPDPNLGKRSFLHFHLPGSKKIVFALAMVLFIILIWSVVFGYQRRQAAELAKKVETTKTSVESKLKKAEDEAFLDMDKSLALIAEAKEEVATLKKDAGDKKADDISSIEKRIQAVESTVVKKEEKDYTEFYDLTLENKSAKGESLYVEDGSVAILDSKNKTIYVLTLEKKSIDKYTASEVSDATLPALYDGKVFFFNPEKGIYEFTSENKVKNIVKKDSDWGTIADFEIYNGNLYLLDTSSDEIYKYLVAEKGYSEKSSYFQSGSSIDLGKATGLTIDSAVYVSLGDSVQKFKSGAADEFKTEYPDKSRTLAGVYTNSEVEQVFTWDREKGSLYVLEKDGKYVRELQSGILKQSGGVFVSGDAAYILAGNKLYTISLE